MRVSVVIPTYKRPESFARCLDALERQQRAPEETLVVVRDGDIASAEVVGARAAPVRLVSVRAPGGGGGDERRHRRRPAVTWWR